MKNKMLWCLSFINLTGNLANTEVLLALGSSSEGLEKQKPHFLFLS